MQQVNLYQPILRKQEKVFSAQTLLYGNLLVLAGLLLLYGYTAYQTYHLESQLEDTVAQRDERRQRLASLRRQYPEPVRDESLEKKIERARQRLDSRQSVFDAVQSYDDRTQPLFSDYLAGLSRQDLPSLWLKRIVVGDEHRLILEGSALAAADVPVLLQRLAAEPVFRGAAFQQVVIERNEAGAQIDFALHSVRREEAQP